LHGRLVDALGLKIIRGELAIDETIDTEQLASDYDVSRTVVREAVRVLAGKGLIDARPRRGTYVRERTNWNLLDPDVLRWQFDSGADRSILEKLHEVRVMVEPAAAELAAMRRTSKDIQTLKDAIKLMGSHGSSPTTIAEADIQFHLGLITSTHNELVEQLSMVIGLGLSARDRYVHTHRIPIERGLQMHQDVADAVEARRPDDARARMLKLLEGAASDVRELGEDTPANTYLAD
jgi:DNA-binding FadR family transcriptional regulator